MESGWLIFPLYPSLRCDFLCDICGHMNGSFLLDANFDLQVPYKDERADVPAAILIYFEVHASDFICIVFTVLAYSSQMCI